MINKQQIQYRNIQFFFIAVGIMLGVIYWFRSHSLENIDIIHPIEDFQNKPQAKLVVKEDYFQKDSVLQLVALLCRNHSTMFSEKIINGKCKIVISPIRNKVIFLGKGYDRFNQYSGNGSSVSIQTDTITMLSELKREAGAVYMALPYDIIYALLINNKTSEN